jgi:hypothetical protein
MTGISGLINLAANLCHEFDTMEMLSIGECQSRSDIPEAQNAFEICGAHLLYNVVLTKESICFLAQTLDQPSGKLELLLRMRDSPDGWQTIGKLIAAMEINQTRSLKRPIEIGDSGPDSYRIG